MNWKVVLALMVTFALMMSSSYTMLIPFLPLYMQNELKATSEKQKQAVDLLRQGDRLHLFYYLRCKCFHVSYLG